MTSTTKRGKNFQPDEKELLVDLVTERADIIESEKSNHNALIEKKNGWIDLVQMYNIDSKKSNRDVKQLQTCWDNLKREAEKYVSEFTREGYATGGGESDLEVIPIYEKILTVIGRAAAGYENPFDSDHQGLDDTKTNKLTTVADLLEDKENITAPNKINQCEEVFDHLKANPSEIPSWKSWSKSSASKTLSALLKSVMKKVLSTIVRSTSPVFTAIADIVQGDGVIEIESDDETSVSLNAKNNKPKYPYKDDEARLDNLVNLETLKYKNY